MKLKLTLILLILIILTINYPFLDSQLIKAFEEPTESGIVERIIDGDTIVINSSSIRLLGINSPEKGEPHYVEAKEFLNQKILNKTVTLKFEKTKYDKYYRKLAYIFLENKNINLESVKEGHSNIYFPQGKTKYYNEFKTAWQNCLKKNTNLCEKSNDFCIKLLDWNIRDQLIILQNICSNNIDLTGWSIKDEGRKKYVFPKTTLSTNEKITLTNKDWNEEYVWTKTGDSLFLRDELGKLVLWESY